MLTVDFALMTTFCVVSTFGTETCCENEETWQIPSAVHVFRFLTHQAMREVFHKITRSVRLSPYSPAWYHGPSLRHDQGALHI